MTSAQVTSRRPRSVLVRALQLGLLLLLALAMPVPPFQRVIPSPKGPADGIYSLTPTLLAAPPPPAA